MRPALLSIPHTLLLCALCMTAAGCSDPDGPEVVAPAVENIVTFEGNDGNEAIFTFRRIDDSPLITLQSPEPLDTANARPGDRLMLRYRPAQGDPDASGSIAVLGAWRINTDVLREGSLDNYADWDADGVFLYSIWRTGTYININCRLTYSQEPRQFMLMLDRATASDPVPQLYLVHKLKEPVNSHDRIYYASFDISALWRRSTTKGVNVHVANTNIPSLSQFQFIKQ